MSQSEESSFSNLDDLQLYNSSSSTSKDGFGVKGFEVFFQSFSLEPNQYPQLLMSQNSDHQDSMHFVEEEKKLDLYQTGLHHEESSSVATVKKKGKKRKDQNVSRGLARKIFKVLEKSHLIQPKSKRDPKILGDIRFLLVLVRIVPAHKRQQTLEPLFKQLQAAYEKNQHQNNEGTRKQLELIKTLCQKIDLSESMDISENLRIMLEAGKIRKPPKISSKIQIEAFLKFEEQEMQKINKI